MPFIPKVGDKFRLLDKEWEVRSIASKDFISHIDVDHYQELAWPLNEADKLDWVKHVPKCSKEFAEAILAKVNAKDIYMESKDSFKDWLDAHTED